MSTTYGTSKSVTIPSDGDTIDAVDVNVPIAALWDEHDVLADLTALQAILVPTHGLVRFVRGYGHYVFVTSGTYSASTVDSPWILTATDGTAGRWVYDGAAYAAEVITARRSLACADANPRGCTSRAKTHDITAGNVVWAPLDWDSSGANVPPEYAFLESTQIKVNDVTAAAAEGRHFLWSLNPVLIQGATLTRVDIVIKGGPGHGALPLMMPALGVVRYATMTSALSSLYSGNMLDDTSANVAAYEAVHDIRLTPDQNATIDLETYNYYAVFCNEGNTNAVAELQMIQLRVRMTARRFAAGVNP